MKTLSANSLINQISNNPSIVENIYLYKLFSLFPIFDNLSTTSILVPGDLSGDILVGNEAVFPLVNFAVDVTVVTVTYDGGTDTTEIVIDTALITAEHVNSFIALKIDITDKLIKDGIKDTINKIEGVELNNFDSGKLDFEVNNLDGYFSNKTKTGLIDSGDIFYVKYLMKFKGIGASDMIYFGGILSLTDSQPDYYNKTYFFRVLGHSQELERYESFNVTDTTNKDLIIISGIEIVEYTSSNDSEVGVKKIEYKPFVSPNIMSGISIVGVSIDTEPGLKKLEFMYPNAFKWDNGAWTDVVNTDLDSEGNKRIYAKGGSGDNLYVILNFGRTDELNTFPDSDMEIWALVSENVVDAGDKVVTDYGEPKIGFDAGVEESIKIHFPRIIKYDDSGGIYSDVSDTINEGYKLDSSTPVFDAVDDQLFIIAPEKFWGMEILFTHDKAGSNINEYEFSYSMGGIIFSPVMTFLNSGLVDNTSGLIQDGTIKWNELTNWTLNNISTADGVSYKGYMIRITKTVHDNIPLIQEIKRILRLRGKTGDFLQLKLYQSKIYTKTVTDEIIIKNVNGILTPAIWYQNITIKQLLDLTLDEANYTSGNRYLTELKVIKTNRYFNIWGKPPKRNHIYNPSVIFIDSTNKYVYVSTKTEIWRCHITGTWELVVAVKYTAPISEIYMHIKKFWVSKDDGLLYIFSKQYSKPAVPYVNQISSVGTLHSYNLITKVLTPINEQSFIYDGLLTIRDGCLYWNGANYTRVIGHGWNNGGGGSISINRGSENLCIPFEQVLRPYRAGGIYALLAIEIELHDELSGYYSFLFYNTFNTGGLVTPKNGAEYNAKNNFYCIESDITSPSDEPFNLGINYNQKGMMIPIDKNGSDADIYVIKQMEDANSDICYYLYSMAKDVKKELKWYNKQHQPLCHYYDADNEIFYLGHTAWGDRATGTGAGDADIPAYSYISKSKLSAKVDDFTDVRYFDVGAGIWTNKTVDANAGNSLGTIFKASGDQIIFGCTNKFRQIFMNLENNANTYSYKYPNGTGAYGGLSNVGIGFKDDDKIISWSIPDDWDDSLDYGVGNLFYVKMTCETYSATPAHTNCELREMILWDSFIDNAGDLERYMPTGLVLNTVENTIHGCLFNRESGGDYPYQWCYFVLDLTNGIMYVTRNGDNYNFDATYSYKDFIYNSHDGTVFCFAESIRHKEKIGFLVKAEYDSDTNIITLTKEGEPRKKEWGNVDLSFDDVNGNIYGISKDKEYSLWEYSTEFYQRIEIANFSSFSNIRNIVSELALFSNCIYMIHSERFIRFIKRGQSNGTFDLTWDENVLTDKPDVVNWEHYYDAVKVEYRSLIIDENGDKKSGYDGWMKKVMSVESILIQNEHIAKLVADNLFDFYSHYRINIKNLKTIPLIQLEMLDKFNLFMPATIIDINSTSNFLIIGISKGTDFNIVLEGLELLVTDIPDYTS